MSRMVVPGTGLSLNASVCLIRTTHFYIRLSTTAVPKTGYHHTVCLLYHMSSDVICKKDWLVGDCVPFPSFELIFVFGRVCYSLHPYASPVFKLRDCNVIVIRISSTGYNAVFCT